MGTHGPLRTWERLMCAPRLRDGEGQERAALVVMSRQVPGGVKRDHRPGGLGERAFLPSASCESDNPILSWSGELEHVWKGALVETEDLTESSGRVQMLDMGAWRRKVSGGALGTPHPRTETGPQDGGPTGLECRPVDGAQRAVPTPLACAPMLSMHSQPLLCTVRLVDLGHQGPEVRLL